MKLAITDACIFIDLIELQLTSEFFSLPIEIHTSLDVFNELYPEQKELLKAYKIGNKLTVHILTSDEKLAIQMEAFPKALSDIDKTVIFIAEKLNAVVLSSDKAVRNYAKTKSIGYHGMLWIFDKFIENNLLSPTQAIKKIEALVSANVIYRNNAELSEEIEKRKHIWKIKD